MIFFQVNNNGKAVDDLVNDNEVMRQWKDEIIRKYDYKMMRNFDDVN